MLRGLGNLASYEDLARAVRWLGYNPEELIRATQTILDDLSPEACRPSEDSAAPRPTDPGATRLL